MRPLVIGVGNSDRGDDGVGPAVARILDASGSVDVLTSKGEPSGLIDAWTDRRFVFLVDACVSGGEAGAIARFDACEAPLPEEFDAISTHGFGVGAAVELSRALGPLAQSLIVYGVEAGAFEPGAPLSAAVEKAAREVAARIMDELSRMPG